jgi:decaprenylphospho-beta-D-erythro-pentofuranosid-2-ulose 2-reductase
VKVVLLGGTKGMGRALGRALIERGDQVFLLGREQAQVQRSAQDLQLRGKHGHPVGSAVCDLEDVGTFEAALDAADVALGGFDTVVVTAGLFGTQQALEADLHLAQRVLTVNFAHTVLFCEHARRRLLARGGGTLCVFSSVAGERGRKPVVLYGAAKAGLSRYLEGLDHRDRAAGLRTITVKPGFVKTGMTAGLEPPPFAGEAEEVAKVVLRALDRGTPVVYAPPIWGAVMAVIRTLPRFMMRRIGF